MTNTGFCSVHIVLRKFALVSFNEIKITTMSCRFRFEAAHRQVALWSGVVFIVPQVPSLNTAD